MKLSNKQIQNILTGMNMISSNKIRLEVGTAFLVAVAKKQLMPVYEAYTETRDDLLDQFCRKDENGQKMKIPEKKDAQGNVIQMEQWDLGGHEEDWKKAVTELLMREEEIDRLKPMKWEQFKLKKVKGADGKEEDGEIDPEILFLLAPWLELE